MDQKINSIQRTVRVLSHICHQKHGVKVAELARSFHTSSPAIYNYLKSLQKEGFIFKDEISGRFRATFRIVELASVVQENNDLTEITYPLLGKLSEELKSTVHLAIQEGDLGVCISKVGNSQAIPSITRVGMSFDLYPTALGKVLLAYLSEEMFADYVDRISLVPYTEKTITDRKALEHELSETRRRGYSIDNEEHRQGLHAVGVPVFDHTDEVVASISTMIPSSISEKQLEDTVQSMRTVAREISQTLGNTNSRD
ncbi:IclR family transcriptional regulator [Sediminispirochaeta smaragdinae]|uniref:Transcriptional regulator, IclR family n=1 Tax=Sediminispirochaeta smaragdinae (strain DSM 11293 / JCM 15392 / SEBR 4228) TaxID=573413 RepID=E1R7P5_SEDSS|nr:IclR family transcriptional regulator [Sediminispirochaeta smaragdinae]ADK82750.1 transcriptional regulator, IclR family [Sediminispirochaeta smaragdinae DSM 11293]